VWSTGVLMWEIWSQGRLPYPGMTNQVVIAQVLEGFRMDTPEDCSEDVSDAIQQCWHAEHTQRPTFTALKATLSGILKQTHAPRAGMKTFPLRRQSQLSRRFTLAEGSDPTMVNGFNTMQFTSISLPNNSRLLGGIISETAEESDSVETREQPPPVPPALPQPLSAMQTSVLKDLAGMPAGLRTFQPSNTSPTGSAERPSPAYVRLCGGLETPLLSTPRLSEVSGALGDPCLLGSFGVDSIEASRSMNNPSELVLEDAGAVTEEVGNLQLSGLSTSSVLLRRRASRNGSASSLSSSRAAEGAEGALGAKAPINAKSSTDTMHSGCANPLSIHTLELECGTGQQFVITEDLDRDVAEAGPGLDDGISCSEV
jgi:hypothetical protein